MSEQVQRVAAYAVCVDDEQRLLLCRLSAMTSFEGMWTLPGGGIDFGEHPQDAARREVFEETGYDARIADLVAVDARRRDVIDDEGRELDLHSIRIVYRGEIVGGELTHETNGSTDMAQWFTRAETAAATMSDVALIGARLAWGD